MNEPASANTGELTRRYRRLLAWYPRDHRERHGEEMLGVLLTGAGDRARPTRKETIDLLRGALRLHLRRLVGADGGIDHRHVLAIVSLLGPIVLLAGSVPVLDRLAAWVQVGSTWATTGREWVAAPVWAVWLAVAVLSLLRMRRTAAVSAWIGTLGFLLTPLFRITDYWNAVTGTAGWLLLGAVVAAALTWSPGPARGWELVGGRRVVLLTAAVALSVVLVMRSFGSYYVLHLPTESMALVHGAFRTALWFLALAVLTAGAVIAGGARTREGRRAALVLSVPVVVAVLSLLLPATLTLPPGPGLVTAALIYVGVPAVALLGASALPRRVRAGG